MNVVPAAPPAMAAQGQAVGVGRRPDAPPSVADLMAIAPPMEVARTTPVDLGVEIGSAPTMAIGIGIGIGIRIGIRVGIGLGIRVGIGLGAAIEIGVLHDLLQSSRGRTSSVLVNDPIVIPIGVVPGMSDASRPSAPATDPMIPGLVSTIHDPGVLMLSQKRLPPRLPRMI